MKHHHGPQCGCPVCTKKVVHPVKENVVNKYTEEVVKHVHPSHTTVCNHHLIKNKHYFPHSTSVANTCKSVDEYAGSCHDSCNQGGGMSPGMEDGNHGGGGHHGGHDQCMKPHMNPWQKPNRWW